MEPIQIIGIIFALFAYSRTILRFKDKKVSKGEFAFWTIIWVSVITVALSPSIAGSMAGLLGVKRPIDIAVYASIIILFYLIFRMYVKLEGVEQNITRVVRNVAIKKSKK